MSFSLHFNRMYELKEFKDLFYVAKLEGGEI